jgi:hypothetical protein
MLDSFTMSQEFTQNLKCTIDNMMLQSVTESQYQHLPTDDFGNENMNMI